MSNRSAFNRPQMHGLHWEQHAVAVVETQAELAARAESGQSALPGAPAPFDVDRLASEGQGFFPRPQYLAQAKSRRPPPEGRQNAAEELHTVNASPEAGLDG